MCTFRSHSPRYGGFRGRRGRPPDIMRTPALQTCVLMELMAYDGSTEATRNCIELTVELPTSSLQCDLVS